MTISICNKTAMTINCNINGKTIEIVSNNQENISLNPNEVALIEHKNESYTEKSGQV